ncbi:universal stress protein [Halococcus hamelinensis]|uniref:UspA domain protein n=1 Tax=Halococcus hamelinensis 100A6 TaxID=1132509 RepID=M0LVW0_9EURY|nr:universal stress protein [Halococcus hamelinensis]EMA37298.1 UspA domain protein [Halococcus hamelinensis 100A6]
MERALVVVDGTDQGDRLLQKAGAIAAGVGTKLYLFATVDPDEFDETRATLDVIADVENTSYSDRDALQSIHTRLEQAVAETFEEPAFEYETIGSVTDPDDRASRIIAAAREYDCEHVFISGRSRSPTGKALFGDTVQSVLLNFDGDITVRLG